MSLFETVQRGVTTGLDTAGQGLSDAWTATRREGEFVIHHPREAARDAMHGVAEGGEWVYDKLIGDDIKTLRDPNASIPDKVIAGLSIASNFVGPEGKLIDKAVSIVAKEALEHGGERLVAGGVKMLEESLGKDAYRELALKGAGYAKELAGGLEAAEKIVERLNLARQTKDAIVATLEDGKALATDLSKVVSGDKALSAEGRAHLLGDIGKLGKDAVDAFGVVAGTKESYHLGTKTVSQLRTEATNTLLEDATLARSQRRVVARGEHLEIDARAEKDFGAASLVKLEKMETKAQADGRRLVVYDPHVSAEQEHQLLEKGISVAKSRADLAKLAVAARLPNGVGVELINLDRNVRTNELVTALKDVKEKHELRETAQGLPAFVRSGPAEVGRKHEQAKPWDGKQATNGTVSWVGEHEVEQYCRGKWTRYEASALSGDLPIEGRQVTIRPDPAHAGHAIVVDPLQQERAQQIERQPVGR